MDPIIELLLKNGVFGILAAVGFYLYFKEHKTNQDTALTSLNQQIEDTQAKVKLAIALEDIAETIKNFRTYMKKDLLKCREHTDKRLQYVCDYLDEIRLEHAREEGRRESIKTHPD